MPVKRQLSLARPVQNSRWNHLSREIFTMTIQRTCGLTAILILLGAFGTVGCSEAERTYDCARICDGYADCIDDSVDRVDCVDRCEDKGEADPDFAEQASDCEMCIDDESCTDATIMCATSCAWVVDEST
jgi:hypothetical protein